MSGSSYFDDLVARALEQAPVLVPRRASRFEPVAAANVFEQDRADLGNEIPAKAEGPPATEKSASAEAPRRSRTESERTAPAHEPGTIEARREQADEERPETYGRPAPQDGRQQEEPARRVEQTGPGEASPHAVEREVKETLVRELRVDRIVQLPAEGEAERLPRQRPAHDATEEPARVPVEEDADSGKQEMLDRIERRVTALEREGSNGSPAIPVKPRMEKEEGARETSPPAAREQYLIPKITVSGRRAARPPVNVTPVPAETAPEHTVQVSIGRIEVRASTPARTVRPQGPAKPRLSLNDYLRQREGG